MSGRRVSDWPIDPQDSEAPDVEKLLTIAEKLMLRAEQGRAGGGGAFKAFRRAVVMKELVRERRRDLEARLNLLNEVNTATERARANLSGAIEVIDEGFALF